ncbi:MFS transporter [Pusillimonas sp. TS35]|nr:MFS transporter [Pusillimonas sp. TS35]
MPLTREHLKACIVLFLVFAIDAWAMMIIVYTAPYISAEMSINPANMGHLIGAIFVGMAIGSLFWGRVANHIGRKTSIIASLALYGVLSGASAFAPDYTWLYALRLLSGIPAAGMFVICFPLFEEMLPVRDRGRLTVYLAAGWPIGMLLAVGVTVLLAPYGWRWIIGVSSLPALFLFAVAAWVPESPYWLVSKNRQSDARGIISTLSRGTVQIPASTQLRMESSGTGAVVSLFRGPLLPISILQILINFTFAWGYWGLQTWLPTLLQQKGLSLPQSFGFIALSTLAMIPGYVASSILTGRLGRKKVVVGFVACGAIAGYAFANAWDMPSLYISNFILVFFTLGAWGVWDAWIAELYPSEVRTDGYGWAVLSQRLANIIAPSTIGLLVALNWSFNLTTTLINMFLVATVLLALLLPETEGKQLA